MEVVETSLERKRTYHDLVVSLSKYSLHDLTVLESAFSVPYIHCMSPIVLLRRDSQGIKSLDTPRFVLYT